ncbi:AAA-like domain-containing protein [Nodosilinea sp. LEGE 07298]|uniref:AAA-like domain-containing protein n=1 Tax=Nodosilinea sp. LEGE 07298 TaxID=2777970 RepID=UPI001D139218|nr:AAA-like domain-containing protein [Nodosilinea sp. LEGE 07298]
MTDSVIDDGQVAAAKVNAFVARFNHTGYRELAYHAALPLVLTPELVHYLRTRFLREANVPWEAEVDLLLSDLCSQVGYELYTMDTQVRAYLLAQMKAEPRWQQRQVEVAQVLITYVSFLSRMNPQRRQRELDAQRLAAMTYLGDESCQQVTQEIAERLKQLESAEAQGESTHSIRAELAYLTRLTQELSPQLEATPELVDWAALVQRLLRQPEAVTQEEAEQSYQIGNYTFTPSALPIELPSTQEERLEGFPPIKTLTFETGRFEANNVANNFPNLKIFTVQVATLEFEAETTVPNERPETEATYITGGALPLYSPFYVERPPIESRCFEAIEHPGCLIRIKGPRQMGKTSLMARILNHAEEVGCVSILINFQLADEEVFKDLDQLLKWLCVRVGRQLSLSNRISDYWDDMFGSKENCNHYFEEYLLAQLEKPLALGLDELDRVISQPDIAADFFGLLRAWNESGKHSKNFRKLRLVLAHSSESYVSLDLKQSPFNVGFTTVIREFNQPEVLTLAQLYQIDFSITWLSSLAALIGGNPYLWQLALHEISQSNVPYEFIDQVLTDGGVYREHLLHHLLALEQYPELLAAFRQVVEADTSVQISATEAFKLESMGLVKVQSGRSVVPFCNLYRQYFRQALGIDTSDTPTESTPRLIVFSFEVATIARDESIGEWQITRELRDAELYEEPLGEEITLSMVAIPGGSFVMGSPKDEPSRQSREGPQRWVQVPRFYMGRYPVTQRQWEFVAALPRVQQDLASDPSHFKGVYRPVERVSWFDAMEFCARLSIYTGREYRLPSEAEWEYACRANTTTPFHFGETLSPELANYSCSENYNDGPRGDHIGETNQVGRFGVDNAFGLSDMHGNVWEWCLDHYHSSYEGAPTDGSAWIDEGAEEK